ncbi:hypothetical protein GUJ93_ZPchr0015g6836 [Zizania palustris]|uniref:Uncharacterized protein n=1 Tax=Zizania palustris TaxID=103762 RepID=A0A8J5W702_ZIZPA|nr:hypothetical protein GUJ93_ZPchr0015g6836 [Zizania palustris]
MHKQTKENLTRFLLFVLGVAALQCLSVDTPAVLLVSSAPATQKPPAEEKLLAATVSSTARLTRLLLVDSLSLLPAMHS